MHTSFLSGWREPVNQWLSLALICLLCFWVVLYYFVNKTEAFGDDFATVNAANLKAYTR